MYLLLSRIPSGLDPLRERFEVHVKKAGTSSVEKTAGDGIDVVSLPSIRHNFVDAKRRRGIRSRD